jgi:hypothetical protein
LKKNTTSAALLLVGAAIMVAPMPSLLALAADQVHDEIQVYNAETPVAWGGNHVGFLPFPT